MQCKFCHEERKLIEAHVIPKSFFEIDPAAPPRLASSKDGIFPKRSPAGIYDTQLVCEDCERLFSPFDDYSQRLLLAQRDAAKPISDGQQVVAHIYESYDYHKLKLFFLSLLWRVSQSSHNFYRRIKLGPHEEIIRQALIDLNPGDSDFYAVLLAKFPRPYGILDPHTTRFEGVEGIRFCQVYLAEYVVYIKVDKQKIPEPFRGLELNSGRPLVILARDPANSKDTQVMREIALKDQRFIKRK
jgi:hypothetical protein